MCVVPACCVPGIIVPLAGPPPQGTARTGPTPARRSDHGSQHLRPGGSNAPSRSPRRRQFPGPGIPGSRRSSGLLHLGSGSHAHRCRRQHLRRSGGVSGVRRCSATRTPQLSKQRSGRRGRTRFRRAASQRGGTRPNWIVERVDPVDQVRLVNSGTEATMSAIWSLVVSPAVT